MTGVGIELVLVLVLIMCYCLFVIGLELIIGLVLVLVLVLVMHCCLIIGYRSGIGSGRRIPKTVVQGVEDTFAWASGQKH